MASWGLGGGSGDLTGVSAGGLVTRGVRLIAVDCGDARVPIEEVGSGFWRLQLF